MAKTIIGLLSLVIIFGMGQSFAQSQDEDFNSITLLESKNEVCPDGEQVGKKECEKIILHEIAINKLQFLIVDGRNKKNGNFDVNHIMNRPEDYYGSIKTIDLEKVFEGVEKPIQLSSVQFTKDNQIKIKFRNSTKEYEKIIPEPN